jgi:peptide/nickel transport system permease protein
MPGSPIGAAIARFKGRLSPAAVRNLEAAFGIHVHESIFQQYLDYLNNIVHLQFGLSFGLFPEPVINVVMEALPWTLFLAGVSSGSFLEPSSAWWSHGDEMEYSTAS